MPIRPPKPEASIVPFISEVRRYLLDSTDHGKIDNWTRGNHIDSVHAFAVEINHNTITMTALLQGLEEAGALDGGGYIQHIKGELLRYLSQDVVNGNTPLMMAAYQDPEAVDQLLDAVNGLGSPEHKAAILSHTNTNGDNVLMMAAHIYPALLAPLLKEVNGLANPEHRAAILSQVNTKGSNLLMMTAYHHPALVVPLLKAINGLADPELMAAMLRQININGYNVLMLTAFFHPELVDPLLETARDLANPELMAALLGQVNTHDNNVLMLAVIHNPQCVDSILLSISTLRSDQKVPILLTTNKEGKTVQDLVSGYHKGALHPSLASIQTAIDSMYSQPPQENSVPVASSSSATSPSVANSFSFFQPETVHSPAPDSSALELAYIVKLTGVQGWRVAGDKLTVEVLPHEKDSVIASLTDGPEIELSKREGTGGRSIISVNRSSLSTQEAPNASMTGPEHELYQQQQPEDEIPGEGYSRPGS